MAAATCSACGQIYPEDALNQAAQCLRCAAPSQEVAPSAESFLADQAAPVAATSPTSESTT